MIKTTRLLFLILLGATASLTANSASSATSTNSANSVKSDDPLKVEEITFKSHVLWQKKIIHLQKGEELLVKVVNPDNAYHNVSITEFYNAFADYHYDPYADDNFDKAVNCEVWNGSYRHYLTDTVSDCLFMEREKNETGDPMTYYFKAKEISGTSYIYFAYYQVSNQGLSIKKKYFPQCLEVLVDED